MGNTWNWSHIHHVDEVRIQDAGTCTLHIDIGSSAGSGDANHLMMQNMTFGADGGLTTACQKKFPEEPGLCFMSPHMQQFIQTPFFMFNR